MIVEDLFKKKKDKNNKITSSSVGGDFVYDAARRGQQQVGFIQDPEKYTKRGITPVIGENLDEYLPETQSAWTKLGNSLVQTVASELAIGIPKAFSDLFDLAGNAIMRNNGDYTNPVSQALEKAQESVKEFAPIYVDPNINISNGGLTDVGWIASNIPSIVSSLTLMLPGAAAVGAIKSLGKAAQVGARSKALISSVTGAAKRVEEGAKLSKFQKFANSDALAKGTNMFLENVATAAISRTIENYQEGRQTYNDMYVQATEQFKNDKNFTDFVKRNEEDLKNAGIDINDKDAVAKYVANKSADETFKLDYLNTVFDVVQLYALKNAWKTLRNAPETSRKILQANKQAAQQLGKSVDDIAKIEEGISKFSKAKNWITNATIGQTKVIGAELSEGVEEAINYIAQQEGMTYGKTLLTGEGVYSDFWDRLTSGFDGRFTSYINSPELWESAFWGVVGGVVFQNGASGIKRVHNTLLAKAAAKENAEAKESKTPWYWLEQLPEIKRRIEDIRNRNRRFDTYRDQLAKINDGIDIFQPIENQAKGQLNSEELKEAARNRAFNDYITDITMSAINNGNYDLLKSYLQDENLRKAMIDSGFFNAEGKRKAEIETESKTFIDKSVKAMEEIANKYDEELIALNNITISNKFKGRVPAEILGIIAVDNIKYQHAIQQQNEFIASTNANIAKEKDRLIKDPTKPDLDPSIDYESSVKLINTAQQLGILRTQRKKIAGQKDSIAKTIALSNIDNQIDKIEKDLKDEELSYATAYSLRVTQKEDGSYDSALTPEFLDYYNNIIVGNTSLASGSKIKFDTIDAELLHMSARTLNILDDTARHKHKLIEESAAKSINELKNISPILAQAYQDKAVAELTKDYLTTFINKDLNSVAKRVGEINNILNEKRNQLIKNKGNIIQDLYVRHGQVIRDIVRAEFEGNTKDLKRLYSTLDPNTITTLKDILKVFDFTKSYNEDIAVSLENAFDEIDRIEKAKRDKAKKNGEIENTTNSQVVSATQTSEPNNISPSTPQANTEQQSAQNEPSPIQNQSQQTQNQPQLNPALPSLNTDSNAAPAPTASSAPAINIEAKTTKVQIPFTTPEGTNSKTRDLKLNKRNDGTYEVIDSSLVDLNDDDIFDNAGVDLTRPHEVESFPIVESKNGKYTLISKGRVVNTDTVDYQERKAREAQLANAQQAQSASSNPSTGEGGNRADVPTNSNVQGNQRAEVAPVATKSTDKVDETIDDSMREEFLSRQETEAVARQELRTAVMAKYIEAKKNKTSFDIDSAVEETIDLFVDKGKNRDAYEACKKEVTSLFRRLIRPKTDKLRSSTDELIIESTVGIFADKAKGIFRLDYTKSIENLIEAYCEEFGIPDVNGKKYLNFEDLLRYLNSLSEDKLTSSIIYYGLNEYLKTKEAKEKYIRTDELGDDVGEAERTINKSESDRFNEIIEASLPRRINLDATSIDTDAALYQEMDSSFNELQIGDELNYETRGNKVIFKTKDGKIVGSNVLPNIDPITGVRTMNVRGFIYDLDKNSTGDTISKLKNVFYRWFGDNTDACKEIRNILYKFAYEKISKEEKEDLIKKFVNNSEIKQAINDELLVDVLNDEFEAEKAIKHLANVFKFKNIKNSFEAEDLKFYLDKWFDKVYDNYQAAIYLSEHPGTQIKVSTINDGKIIRNAEYANKKVCTPVSQAIAGGANPKINKITVTNYEDNTLISGSYPTRVGFKPNSTHVTIPNRNGSIEYVQAFPSNVNDNFLGEDAKEIVNVLRNQIKTLIRNFAKDRSIDNFHALKNFLIDTFDYKNKSCLFYGAKAFLDARSGNIVFKNGNGKYNIRINYNKNIVDIYDNETKVEAELTDKKVLEIVDKIIDGLNFNINDKLVRSDNRSNDDAINGILSKEDNQFTIKIGDRTWTYSSFNEFVLKNNIVSINTHPNGDNTSNFEKNEFTSLEYEILPGQIETPQTPSPVEESDVAESIDIPAGLSKEEQVLGILNGNIPTEHKGEAIFKLFNNDEETLNALKHFGLLPENIIFDEKFNDSTTDNAETNLSIGQVKVGPKWLNLFKTNRSYAIRVLIHEQLHNTLQQDKNKQYIQSLNEVFNEFKNSISRDSIKHFIEYYKEKQGIPTDKISVTEEEIDNWLNQINTFKYEQYSDSNIQLEEFLVDSLMNGNLAEYLNSVKTDVKRKGGSRNLFQKILELLNKIFGWNIEKDSLREKEFYALRKSLTPSKKFTKTAKKTSKKQTIEAPTIPGLFDESEQTDTNKVQDEAKSEQVIQDEVQTEQIEDDSEEQSDEEIYESDEDFDILADYEGDDVILVDDKEILNDDDEINDDWLNDDFEVRDSSTDELILNYTSEIQSIKDKAITDGTFMKAPNGNPTNLNERQWLQVRTKNFLNWFGDWINNPSEASKVVDENGEPLVVYRWDNANFTTFNKNKQGSKYKPFYGKGFYFTSSKYFANWFGSKHLANAYFLNSKDLEEVDWESKYKDTYIQGDDTDYGDRHIVGIKYNMPRLKNKILDEFVISNPNQIKSATSNTGEFSTTNDDIRYSSTDEITLTTSSSFLDAQSQLPIELRQNFASAVRSAEIQSQCK